jgi:general secretion pathway protein F
VVATGKAAGKGLAREIDVGALFGAGVSSQDLAIATRQLSTLIGAGITLVEALTALTEQVEHPRLKRILGVCKQKVNEGTSLADALGEHPKVFSTLYVNMIRAGESSGALDVVLERLADFTESSAQLRSKLIGAMLYPAIMILVGIGIVTILFMVVIPKVTKIFEDMNATLPLNTRILIALSNFARDYWYVVLVGTPALLIGAVRWLRTPKGSAWFDQFQLRVPVLGDLVRMLAISRFAKTLSTLLSSGVQLLVALDIVRNVVSNSVIAKVIEDARDAIREGESIAAPLKRSGQFPPLVFHMIAIGEKSGQLEQMLANVAKSYDTQVDIRISALTSLLEPVMIVVMGGAVAFIVFSILMPIMQLNTFVPK